jgi:hypothetical protein
MKPPKVSILRLVLCSFFVCFLLPGFMALLPENASTFFLSQTVKTPAAEAGPIAWVKNLGTTSSKTAGTTLVLTVTGAVSAGDSIIVTVTLDYAAGAVTCTDGVGNTYSADASATNGSTLRTVIFAAHNVTALAAGQTITVTHPSVTARAMVAAEFTGLVATATLDRTATASGSSTAANSGNTAVTTLANELLIGAIGVEGPSGDTFTKDATYTLLSRAGTTGGVAATNVTVNGEYRIVSATGAYAATGTLGTSRTWAAAIATYKWGGLTLSGTVFEDVNYGGGAGRSLAGASGVGRQNARVELYDGSGNFVNSALTNASGVYSFPGLFSGNYTVRVVNSSVTSSRTGYVAGLLPVQTFRTNASSGTAVAVTDYVGGQNPSVADAGNGAAGAVMNTATGVFTAGVAGTAQSITNVTAGTGNISSLDFGFNFDTIVNRNDSGQGSLRQFLTNANTLSNTGLAQAGRTAGIENAIFMLAVGAASPGMNAGYTSQFVNNVATIAPTSALPTITDPVVLNAQTQPGWWSVPIVELNGAGAGSGVNGLLLSANDSTVRGLVINRFQASGIQVNGTNNLIAGNWIGVDATGMLDRGNAVDGITISGNNTTIGGLLEKDRNVVSGNDDEGIDIDPGVTGVVIKGNYIGTDATGTAAIGNGTALPSSYGGIIAEGTGTQIGGSLPGEGNLVSGNYNGGIYLPGTGNIIEGNKIGTDATGTTGIPNSGPGILVSGASNNRIGGATAGQGNTIAFNAGDGIRLASGTGTGNAISANTVFSNTGLGIDLNGDGVTANDGAKPAGQPNLLMDFPVFTAASVSGSTLTLAGYVGSAANQALFANARVEIFKSDNSAGGYGQGKIYLGFVTTNASGNISATLTVTGLAPGDRITGTATDGSNNTSEFGANFTVTSGGGRCPGFTVTTTTDNATAGSGSLRDCISAANATSGATITVPAGTYTLTLAGSGENANATGDLDLLQPMTITGAGADLTILDGNGIDRVFDVRAAGAVALSNLTIRNGNPGAGNDGGGIATGTAALTLTNVTVSGGTARDGAGVYNNSGTVTLNNVTVSGNSATRNGGGLYTNTGSVALTNVTVGGNTATTSGGGLYNASGPATTLTNVTIASNSAATGGGIRRNGGTVTLKNTIVANSTSGGNCSGTITSTGYNLDSANTCVFTQPGDKINTNPLLGPLQFNGGTTFTHALLKGSPAIDAIVVSNGYPATDQRGVARPQDGLNTGTAYADIGAFEYEFRPTAVKLKSFTATMTDHGVALRWRTGHEVRNLGFHVYREEAGQLLRLTPAPIAGSALLTGAHTRLTAGHTYMWADPSGMAGSQYWLEDLDLNGIRTAHGPVSAVWTEESARLGKMDQPASALLHHLGRKQAHDRGFGNSGGRGTAITGTSLPPLGPPCWAETRAGLPESAPERLRQQWAIAGRPAVKLRITTEGWYRVAQPALVAAGLDPRVDARTLQLFVDGEEQPLYLSGRVDRSFGPADIIEFYGVGLDTLWTDTRTYWLTWGTQQGQRVAVTPVRAGTPVAAQSFPFTVERADRIVYIAALLNGEADNFVGPVITPEPVDQDLALSHLDPGPPGDAVLEVVLQGLSMGPHTVRILLNGGDVGHLEFADQNQGVFRIPVPQAHLLEGANRVTLMNSGDEMDVSALERVRLTYWHSYTADGDQLRFTIPGGQTVTLTGFSAPRIGVVDITDPHAPQRLVGTVRSHGTDFALTVTAPGAGERTLLAFVEERAPTPTVTAHRPSQWHQGGRGADLVIITHPMFLESTQPLQSLHEGQGLKVALINVEDLYAEFSFGTKTPWALRAFLQRARTQWQRPPRFALLMGGASMDPKNYLGFGDLDFVPTKLVDTTLLETASDDWFADFDGSGGPQIALGRLPVRTVAEATTVVQKLVTYAQTPPAGAWSKTALLVADTPDEFDFTAASTQAASWLPAGLSVQRIDAGQLGIASARAALLQSLDQGQRLVHYVGHGSVEVWDGEGLLTTPDAATLVNGPRLPVVVAMTCLNGLFHDPGAESLAAALLIAPTGGAVAVWASSGLSDPAAQAPLDRAFLQRLGAGAEVPLGEAARAAKAVASDPDVRRTWIFFGDPALRWVAPPSH